MKIIILLLLLTNNAFALDESQAFIDVGLGIFGSEGNSLSQNKFIKIGDQEQIIGPLQQRFNLGGWLDTRGNNYSSSAFLGYQLGFEVSNNLLQASIWSGPTLISNPDNDLGGIFQFNETIFFGIVDQSHDAVGLVYNHFSSAGIEMPNIGKDFGGLEIKFPF